MIMYKFVSQLIEIYLLKHNLQGEKKELVEDGKRDLNEHDDESEVCEDGRCSSECEDSSAGEDKASDEKLVLDMSSLNVNDVLQPLSEEELESEDDGDEDDADWITPENVARVKQQMDFGLSEDKEITVGCITTDFSMQVRRRWTLLYLFAMQVRRWWTLLYLFAMQVRH